MSILDTSISTINEATKEVSATIVHGWLKKHFDVPFSAESEPVKKGFVLAEAVDINLFEESKMPRYVYRNIECEGRHNHTYQALSMVDWDFYDDYVNVYPLVGAHSIFIRDVDEIPAWLKFDWHRLYIESAEDTILDMMEGVGRNRPYISFNRPTHSFRPVFYKNCIDLRPLFPDTAIQLIEIQ